MMSTSEIAEAFTIEEPILLDRERISHGPKSLKIGDIRPRSQRTLTSLILAFEATEAIDLIDIGL